LDELEQQRLAESNQEHGASGGLDERMLAEAVEANGGTLTSLESVPDGSGSTG
jgi:hypothetical protein